MLEMLSNLYDYLAERPMVAMVLGMLIYSFVSKRMQGPFPEAGGRVVTIKSEAEWDAALGAAGDNVVVADFYATWCPPCRRAAPVYGVLSTKYDGCEFLKVDVDACPAVSRREGIRAMPTFKFYKKGACVETIQGFNQQAVEQKLATLGARPAAGGAAEAKAKGS